MLPQLRKSLKLSHPHFFCHRRLFLFSTTTPPTTAPSQPCLPSPLLHSPAQPSPLQLKLHLLHQENLSPSQVKSLMNNRYFRAASFQRIHSHLSLLRAKGVPGALATNFLTRSPSLFACRVEGLEEKWKFYQNLGIERLALQKLLTGFHARSLLGTAVNTLQKHIDFLQSIGLKKQDIPRIVKRYPPILFLNADRKMKATLEFFDRHGLSRDGFLRLVQSHPHVFSYSIDRTLTEKLKFLQELGLPIHTRTGARAFTDWMWSKPEWLLAGWGMLKNHGFSDSDIRQMVVLRPEVLRISEGSVERKIDYLKYVLNRDLQEVSKYPTYLCLSLQNKIIARFTFLDEFKESAKRTKTLSLGTLLGPSDVVFESRYATGYGTWKAKYLKKQSGAG